MRSKRYTHAVWVSVNGLEYESKVLITTNSNQFKCLWTDNYDWKSRDCYKSHNGTRFDSGNTSVEFDEPFRYGTIVKTEEI